jgi:hypothetical protein
MNKPCFDYRLPRHENTLWACGLIEPATCPNGRNHDYYRNISNYSGINTHYGSIKVQCNSEYHT